MDKAEQLFWARFTLTASLIINPMLFHSMCALINRQRRYVWWIVAAYMVGAIFVGLLWDGMLVTGIKRSAIMHHYVHYNRALYPLVGLHIVFWQLFGAVVLAYNARRAVGYKRTQLVYFIVAWLCAVRCTYPRVNGRSRSTAPSKTGAANVTPSSDGGVA